MTMRPYLRSRMWSHTALQQLAAPITCTSRTSRKSARSIFAKLLSRMMPALLTRMSIWPQRFSVSATIACTASKSVTDAAKGNASPPAAMISSTTFCAGSAFMSLTTTFAPRRPRSRACSRPRPEPAPVTIATRPVRSIMPCSLNVALLTERSAFPRRAR